jgi:hypothetical protein
MATLLEILVCDCGDCRHWEIAKDKIICKSCEKEFPVPGLEEFIQAHVELHPQLSWKMHER